MTRMSYREQNRVHPTAQTVPTTIRSPSSEELTEIPIAQKVQKENQSVVSVIVSKFVSVVIVHLSCTSAVTHCPITVFCEVELSQQHPHYVPKPRGLCAMVPTEGLLDPSSMSVV